MKFISLSLLTLLLSPISFAANYDVEEIANDLNTPWGIEFISDHQMIVTEKSGQISLLDIVSGEKTQLHQVDDVDTSGQGGLLDVAHIRDTQGNVTLYFSYSKASKNGTTLAIAKGHLSNNELSSFEDIFIADAHSDTSHHFGSRIVIVNGYLMITLGDRGERDNGQDTTKHAASILRLDLEGNPPIDNPFYHQQDARAEIWSYGHRNPQGLFFDVETQTLWSVEHGPRGGDEINRIEKGANYGWARVSHGREYWGPLAVGEATTLPGMVDPELVYIPSIAPSNLVLYRGNIYPELDGKLLVGALKLAHINVVDISGNTLKEHSRLLESLNQRIRDITIAPDDHLYFSTDSGNIYRLVIK
ncbi:PQQ-dependent sugar dehydrogenase [Vibrio astriarenae]